MNVVADAPVEHVDRRYSNRLRFAKGSGDYPTGVFELLASKEAELDLLKQREQQLELEISSLKRNCQKDLKAG
ncbi:MULTISPECIES: hypothetical protein [unclassified Agarivorans]|uniref:hypothetical protein n=1 Tax=unclassified Agarivorans TaxID=2636026 RepID=UPI0010ED7E3E|nr:MULTISPECIES: hypothetical protein [unclassified Agarivorans]MDO6687407.1 hypothetical protein [Agarivorans sp. 3_MG-2023]MDO6715173.1 hypothetical protein [Agarivorans sp. 2_MG-2023]MDO6763530.1 hypothetical protein [Agarivorans sp. 1_MG-2023]GDY27207.1 hypothetical protein AHAT_30970 [Agarivorans sp. Toyoura001]